MSVEGRESAVKLAAEVRAAPSRVWATGVSDARVDRLAETNEALRAALGAVLEQPHLAQRAAWRDQAREALDRG